MFCGIVETVGSITAIKANGCKYFTITTEPPFTDLSIGESIAINGVCLTVTSFQKESFNVTIVPETLSLTNLEMLELGSQVNLERSLTINTRVGGHFVQGHVDAVGRITSIIAHQNSEAWLVKITAPEKIMKYIVKKGFVTIDGMSITVIDVGQDFFTITLIPHTQNVTIAQNYHEGSLINIEVDMIGKYIEKLLGGRSYVSN